MTLEDQIKQAEEVSRAAEDAAKAARDALFDLKCKLSEKNCPHKVGDVIEVANGYSHTGKKMRILRFLPPKGYVRLGDGGGRFTLTDATWRAEGAVLKKDGTDSTYEAIEYGI